MIKPELKQKEWVTLVEAHDMTGVPIVTLRSWRKRGLIETQQLEQGKRRSPVYVNVLSIPTFLRKRIIK